MSDLAIIIFYAVMAVILILDGILFIRRLKIQDEFYDDACKRLKQQTRTDTVFYLCDCKNPRCGPNKDCDFCHHTTDISHASNFEYRDGVYWEKE